MLINENLNPEEKLIQSEILPQSKKKRSGTFRISFWNWTFQLNVWAGITLVILDRSKILIINDNERVVLLIATGVNYLIYMIFEFCSPTCRYLFNKKHGDKANLKMGVLFKTKPIIQWSGSAYHYETYTYTDIDANGYTHTETRTIKETTFRDSKNFSFLSHRDVSGLLLLRNSKGKSFIKLNLDFEINFAESISYSNYIIEKNKFESWIASHDTYYYFKEKRFIPGLNKYNLVQISKSNPCFVNLFWFIFFTIIPLAQIYKYVVKSFCVYQNFVIRKLISTIYDLSDPKIAKQRNYEKLTPKLDLNDEVYNFTVNEYCETTPGGELNLPPEDEIRKAEEKYNQYIPNYQTTPGYNNISNNGNESGYNSNYMEEMKNNEQKDNQENKLKKTQSMIVQDEPRFYGYETYGIEYDTNAMNNNMVNNMENANNNYVSIVKEENIDNNNPNSVKDNINNKTIIKEYNNEEQNQFNVFED